MQEIMYTSLSAHERTARNRDIKSIVNKSFSFILYSAENKKLRVVLLEMSTLLTLSTNAY